MVRSILKKIIYKSNVSFSINGVSPKLGRLDFDSKYVEYLSKTKKNKLRLPTVSVIYRVKNGSSFIESSIYSIIPLCSEIIIVDNGSTDDTLSIINRLKKELENIVDIKIFSYLHKVRIAGSPQSKTLKSLSEFYTYCFSLGKSDYLFKFDAHCILYPKAIEIIQRKLMNNPKRIYFRGSEICGKKLSIESYIFKNDGEFKYIENDKYEILKFSKKDSFINRVKNSHFSPLFIHIKRLSYSSVVTNSDKHIIEEIYK